MFCVHFFERLDKAASTISVNSLSASFLFFITIVFVSLIAFFMQLNARVSDVLLKTARLDRSWVDSFVLEYNRIFRMTEFIFSQWLELVDESRGTRRLMATSDKRAGLATF